MHEQRQNIALLLILLLVFPLAGQSFHVIIHHHHLEKGQHDQLTGTGICKHSDPCLICKYEFTTYTSLQDNVNDNTSPPCVCYIYPFIPILYHGFSGSDISLRAPPAIV